MKNLKEFQHLYVILIIKETRNNYLININHINNVIIDVLQYDFCTNSINKQCKILWNVLFRHITSWWTVYIKWVIIIDIVTGFYNNFLDNEYLTFNNSIHLRFSVHILHNSLVKFV